MASFDPSTAYQTDWQHHDFIEAAEYEPAPHSNGARAAGLKVRREDIDHSDFIGLAATLAITERTTGFVVWQTTDECDPQPNGVLRLASGGYVVKGSRRSRFGYWVLLADEERVDG